MSDSLISWRSKKQTVVDHFNIEVEYRSLEATTLELIWLCWLLQDLGVDCCNHLTSSIDVVSSHTSTSLPTIYTANGSPMLVSHLGNVSTPALSVSNVYQIP